MAKNTVPIEDAAGRDGFINKAVDAYLDSRTQAAETMRHVSVTAFVASELSQNTRRPLSAEERVAVTAASASKLAKRFGT